MTTSTWPRLPVVMYHSVGRPNPDWLWDELTCPAPFFAAQLAALAAHGYEPAGLDDVLESQVSGGVDSRRRVVLTFDDGYLDNWVYVYPLLKRAGWRGAVYVNPEFIDPGEQPRPNLEDYWAGRCSESDLRGHGFLNWSELEILDRSGVLRIASHSMSHTWHPISDEIVDFHRPGAFLPWLAWNARPDRKSQYLTEDQSGYVPLGTPVYRHGRSLGIRRWIPDPDVTAALTAHVARQGGAGYFERHDWQEQLREVAREADRGRGRAETDDELRERYTYEIVGARDVLSARLGRDVADFCWPGGAYNDDSWNLASAAGFRTITVRKSDRARWDDPTPGLVRRISDYHQYSLRGRRHNTRNPALLALACDHELGRRGARWALHVGKLMDAVGITRTVQPSDALAPPA